MLDKIEFDLLEFSHAEQAYFLDNSKFSGVAFETLEDGNRIFTTFYRGVKNGKYSEWNNFGQLLIESNYLGNMQHGLRYEWDRHGVKIKTIAYEYGIIVAKWEGEINERKLFYVIEESHDNFKLLL